MKLRLESKETGEFLCEVDVKDLDIEKIIQYSLSRLQSENNNVKYKIPLSDNDVRELIEYAFVSILKDEIKEYEGKNKSFYINSM